MSLGLVGRKVGMTRIFTDDGVTVPVTVLDVSNNRVTQIKTPRERWLCRRSGGFRQTSRLSCQQAMAGHLAKAGVEAGHVLKEFPVSADELAASKPGDQISVTIFAVGQKVDVTGATIGKGFAGAIKRHHFKSQRAAHGNSVSHKALGFHRYGAGSGSRFSGQAHGRSSGRRASAPSRILKSFVLMSSVSCCWSRAPFPAPRASDVIVRPAVKAGA